MRERFERLKWAREKAGYATAADAARAMEIDQPTYFAHENGSRGLSRSGDRYAKFFRVSYEWLMSGTGEPGLARKKRSNSVTVVGYIGAGSEIYPIDDHAPGGGLDEVEIDFPVPEDTVGAVVRGDSMLPVFENGDLIGYRGQDHNPEDLLGKTCVVKLMDGRVMIKKLRRGSDAGLFTLTSHNASDVEDVTIDWARPFLFRIPSDAWRKL